MTAYPKPATHERIVVSLKSAARAGSPGQRSAEQPRTTIAEVAMEPCLGFAESRRTGNIEVTFQMPGSQRAGEPAHTEPASTVHATPIASPARPRPHAAMPVPQGDFSQDLRQVAAEAPSTSYGEVIESLLADARMEASEESSCPKSTAQRLQTGMDVRLARIIDAWPQLGARTRAALAATLDNSQVSTAVGGATEETRPIPMAVASPRSTGSPLSTNRRRKRAKD